MDNLQSATEIREWYEINTIETRWFDVCVNLLQVRTNCRGVTVWFFVKENAVESTPISGPYFYIREGVVDWPVSIIRADVSSLGMTEFEE